MSHHILSLSPKKLIHNQIYPQVIKHGLPENGPFLGYFPSYKPPFVGDVQGFSSQPCLITRGYTRGYIIAYSLYHSKMGMYHDVPIDIFFASLRSLRSLPCLKYWWRAVQSCCRSCAILLESCCSAVRQSWEYVVDMGKVQ